ncbi:MAG TPA: DNA-directed RNA polymerase subunit beta', partial [Candidatus Ozemobacteraceae bacterium]|nr:DNA-directed RNA polymerase subunit beta' [Candidatus Ozemobacteraceae bacterium]
ALRSLELFECRRPKKEAVISDDSGVVRISGNTVSLADENGNEKPVRLQGVTGLIVHDGEYIEAGDSITEGKTFPKKLVKCVGLNHVRRYLVDEIQRVYREQGVSINDKHLEIIIRQMLRKVVISDPGETDFLPNETVHVKAFEESIARMESEKRKKPTGYPMIQGITKASLTTDSFISAASFQETTRVLTKAAIKSKVDYLRGLKENLIIGKLIPAGTGLAISKKINFKNLPIEIEKTETTDGSEELFNTQEIQEEIDSELFVKKADTGDDAEETEE